MWYLKKIDGEEYPLFTRSEHIVGRTGTLELSTDASVSRRHASIVVTLKNGGAIFTLQDLGSKYGTYLNEGIISVNAISKSEPVILKIGDRIRFGMQANIWILEESRFVTCTSLLSSQDKSNLKNILSKLNGEIAYDWTIRCTHITMTQVKTTIKAICASAEVKPIVSLNYWNHLANAFFGPVETPLPSCDDFVPPIAEPQLKSPSINLKMNKNRKNMFQGFKFIVFGRGQLSNISPIVEAAGGIAVDGNSFEISENELCREKVIVVQDNSNDASSSNVLRVSNILNSNRLRPIKDTEIYLSIFECSTTKYCNPRYDASILLQTSDSEISVKDEATILAVDTQDNLPDQETQFLETASGNFSLAVNEKFVFSDSEDEDIILGTDPSIISSMPPNSTTGSTKRKFPEVLESAVKMKSAKLDSWLVNKKVASSDNCESSASESIFSASSKTNKKGFKDLFSFRASKKDSDRASSSLFNINNNSSQPSAPVFSPKQNKSRTDALFATKNNQVSEADDLKASRTASLFANVTTSRTTRSSNSLFSVFEEPSLTKNSSLGKRKRKDEVDSEAKSCSRTENLFKRQTKRPSVVHEIICSDSDDESDLIAEKTSKLNIVNDSPVFQDSPVDIPPKMSLSQFQCAPAKENVMHIKTKAVSPTEETHEKSVVHTVPLVLSNEPNILSRPVDNSAVNFKKFRKNHVCYPKSPVFNKAKFFLFSGNIENGFHDD